MSNQLDMKDQTKPEATVVVKAQSAADKRKQKMQDNFKKMVQQIKSGCPKAICFNKYCKNNRLNDSDVLAFDSDQKMMQFILGLMNKAGQQFEDLICSDSTLLTRSTLKSESETQIRSLIEDAPAFCCSFYHLANLEFTHNKPSQVLTLTSQPVSEVSAFADVDMTFEPKEESKCNAPPSNDMKFKSGQWRDKYIHMAIDYKAVQMYFKTLKDLINNDNQFREIIGDLIMTIEHTWELAVSSQTQDYAGQQKLMCVRGLLMLFHLPDLEDYAWQDTGERVGELFNSFYQEAVVHRNLEDDDDISDFVKFISVCPSEQLLDNVSKQQGIITISIISNMPNLPLIKASVKVMDIIFWINSTFRTVEDRIKRDEFYNDAINNAIDLKSMMKTWVQRTQIRLRNGGPKTIDPQFNLCDYTWILNLGNRCMLMSKYNAITMIKNRDQNILSSFMNPQAGKTPHLFLLEVDRENLVEDSLQKIVTLNKQKNLDPLTLPIEVRFKGEPGIDEGGVRKEYFELVMKELFSSTYGMFKCNENSQMYWFNGESAEMPLNFELVGTLMGIAMYNDCHIEVPLVSVIYKFLLGGKPDFEDLAHWQPEIARSFEQDLLTYDVNDPRHKDMTHEQFLEALCRTFTVTVEYFGATKEVELKEGGSEIYVDKSNVEEFVRLYIEYEFEVQCATQLNSFRKGFERLVDINLVKEMIDQDELETTICGPQELDFKDLRSATVYAEGFKSDSPMMKWLWEIVLEEWDDKQRRVFLAFSTGSKRAPVSGLKNMKFFIVRDKDCVANLPTSHTCFNQLHMPEYTSKDILREKLEVAMANAEGFGMV